MPPGGFRDSKKSSASTIAKENHAAATADPFNAFRAVAVRHTFVRTAKNKVTEMKSQKIKTSE
jgi:hypothetical protein